MAIPGPAYKAAPTPVNTKIPVPITLPMPKKTKSNAVKLRTNPDFSASCAKCAMSFFQNKFITFTSLLNCILIKKKALRYFSAFFLTGNFLSSQHVSMQVLSASKCLTTVFGMGTGGTI